MVSNKHENNIFDGSFSETRPRLCVYDMIRQGCGPFTDELLTSYWIKSKLSSSSLFRARVFAQCGIPRNCR